MSQVARMKAAKINNIPRFGLIRNKGGVHTARTLMLEDLRLLLLCVSDPGATKDMYCRAIEEENCLGKRSGKTRVLTEKHLLDLYALDPSVTIFRSLLYFWKRDAEGQPLLALLCAYARDTILRMSAQFILKFPVGAIVSREGMEKFIEEKYPGRFSTATLKSTAQNLNSTWTKSGHLAGRIRKVRSRVNATSGSVSYALFLGYLSGIRGAELFRTEYASLLDYSAERLVELAEEASRRGWITFKRVGDVMEILFPNLLTAQEMEWIREQS